MSSTMMLLPPQPPLTTPVHAHAILPLLEDISYIPYCTRGKHNGANGHHDLVQAALEDFPEEKSKLEDVADAIARHNITDKTRAGHLRIVRAFVKFMLEANPNWTPEVNSQSPFDVRSFITKKCSAWVVIVCAHRGHVEVVRMEGGDTGGGVVACARGCVACGAHCAQAGSAREGGMRWSLEVAVAMVVHAEVVHAEVMAASPLRVRAGSGRGGVHGEVERGGAWRWPWPWCVWAGSARRGDSGGVAVVCCGGSLAGARGG
ncbi:hypothetical protein JB92DRAFT_2825528 [Gautieria morchelliformis]|nr:hypothetical protein JB92DRAFT_2825528 [Gautieria morchelliformis]